MIMIEFDENTIDDGANDALSVNEIAQMPSNEYAAWLKKIETKRREYRENSAQ